MDTNSIETHGILEPFFRPSNTHPSPGMKKKKKKKKKSLFYSTRILKKEYQLAHKNPQHPLLFFFLPLRNFLIIVVFSILEPLWFL